MKRKILALLLVSLLPGCGGGQDTSASPGERALSSEELGRIELWKLELMLADRASNTELREQGPSNWSTHFAPEGSVIRPGVGEIQGQEAVHDAFMADIYSNTLADLQWNPERAEVSTTGDLGYTVGEYVMVTVDTAGARSATGGAYVRIWARQDDGRWKITMEVKNPTTEPEILSR